MNIAIVIGSVRKNRVGERVAKFVAKQASDNGLSVNVVDPLHTPFPLLSSHYHTLDDNLKTEQMGKVAQIFDDADGFILVSAEYNGSIPPALSNIIDHFQREFVRKPVATVTYSVGQFGGRGVAAQLPALISGVGAVPVPVSMPIPTANQSLDENGVPQNDLLPEFASKFFNEYKWYLNALKSARH